MQQFKVICIWHPEPWKEICERLGIQPPVIMGEYTVVYVGKCCSHCNGSVFRLAEHESKFSWAASAFATLPDQTAEEMSEESRESITNIEHQPV